MNPITPDRLQVCLFLSGGDHWIAGIHYTRNLVAALALLPPAERPRLILKLGRRNQGRDYEAEFAGYPGLLLDGPAPRPTGLAALAATLRRKVCRRLGLTAWLPLDGPLLSDRCSVLFPHKVPGRAGRQEPIYWITDFQHHRHPENYDPAEIAARDQRHRQMLAEESIIVLSSRQAAADLERFYPGPRRALVRLLPFHTVLADDLFRVDPGEVADRYGLPEKFALCPNQFWRHKGHETLFAALLKLRDKGLALPLVCTGATAGFDGDDHALKMKAFLQDSNLLGQVRLTGLIPGPDLVQLFRRAAVVVHPSRFEGWSTVVEDARALGRPLVLSDLAVHREQDPTQAVYFAVGQAEELAARLGEVWPACRPGVDLLAEAQARAQAEERGRAFARAFVAIALEAEALRRAKLRRNGGQG